ncbi:Flotillin protein 3 [Spatholobus suberectus]|nr:Flotillin protein 3 [Spatholobus suberectus]
MNALTTTEKLKAEYLSKASVEYETKVQEANWELYKKQKPAKAILFEKEKEIAKTNADAIRGLQPKISIWTNGGEANDGSGGMKDVVGVYKMLPPLLKTVHEQTGMLPPTWMGTCLTKILKPFLKFDQLKKEGFKCKVDEQDDKEQVLALNVAQKLDLLHLHETVEKMYHDLNAVSVKVEKISHDLNMASRMVETMNQELNVINKKLDLRYEDF